MIEKNKKACIVSVLMLVHNEVEYLHDAIKSVLNQSFAELELIILSLECNDSILSITESFNDNRIRFFSNNRDYVSLFNKGIELASGKYVALMFADNMMHIDRLKIQSSIMETEPAVTICTSWIRKIGSNEEIQNSNINKYTGLIEKPLLAFLNGNFIFLPATMIRKDFLTKHNLYFENYFGMEDFKFWIEIAKHYGHIYIDNQCLLYARNVDIQINNPMDGKQNNADNLISDILEYLLEINKTSIPELESMLLVLKKLHSRKMLTTNDMASFFLYLFSKNNNKLLSV